MKKYLLLLMLVMIPVAYAAIHDPSGFSNVGNAFDKDYATSATKSTTFANPNYQLGETFDYVMNITKLNYSVKIEGYCDGAGSGGSLKIQTYDGSTWSDEYQIWNQTCESYPQAFNSGTRTGVYTLPSQSTNMGYRVFWNYISDTTGTQKATAYILGYQEPAPILQNTSVLLGGNYPGYYLDCSFKPLNINNNTLNVSLTWYKNDVNVATYDYIVQNPTLEQQNTTGNGTGRVNESLDRGDRWYCSMTATDGNVTSTTNSAEYTIEDITYVTSNISSIPTVKKNFTVNVSYWNIQSSVVCGVYTNTSNLNCSAVTAFNNQAEVLCIVNDTQYVESVNASPYCTNGTVYNTTGAILNIDTEYKVSFYGWNMWNNSNVGKLNVNLTNSTGTYNFTDTTGNLTLMYGYADSGCNAANITFYSEEYMNNYTLTTDDCNLSESYNYSFYQAILNVFVYNNVTDTLIDNSIIQVNDSSVNNVTTADTGILSYFINADTFSINATKSSYTASDINVSTIPIKTNYSVNVTLGKNYNIFLRREQDNSTFNLTESGSTNYTITLDVYCPSLQVRHVIDSAFDSIDNVDCVYDYWLITLTSSTDTYYRTIKPPRIDEDIYIYLLDLKVDTGVQMNFQLNDLSGTFGDGYLEAKKYINGTATTVILQYWDVEDKTVFWFDQSEAYELFVTDNNGEQTSLGDIVADTADTKTIVLPAVQFYWDTQFNEVQYIFTANKSKGEAYLTYIDTSALGLANLTWYIEEYNSTTEVFYYSNQTTGNTTITATNLNLSKSYLSFFILDHNDNTYDITIQRPLWWASSTTFEGFEAWNEHIKLWSAVSIPILMLMIATILTVEWVFIIVLIIVSVFNQFDWYNLINEQVCIISATNCYNRISILISIFAVLTAFMWFRKFRGEK